jgi:hypothetical protein
LAAIAGVGQGAARCNEVAAQLDYTAAPGCPVAADFEAVVAQRLGYSPFWSDAAERVVVRIQISGQGLEGRLEWRNADGQWIGDRLFPSRSADCRELVRVMGFALALQVQLWSAGAAPSDSEQAEPSEVARAAPTPSSSPTLVAPAPPPPTSSQPEIRGSGSRPSIAAGAGASVGVGLAPGAVALGRVFGTVAWSHVAVELGAELGMPSTLRRADGAGFSEQLLFGSLASCGLRSAWSACLVAKVGQIRVAGEGVDVPVTSSGLLIQTGLRVAVTYPLGRRVLVAAHADGLTLITRGVVTLDSLPAWTTPRVGADLGVDVGVRFP